MDVFAKIKSEYIEGELSYRELAEKYSVPIQKLAKTGAEENWVSQRKAYRERGADNDNRLDNVTKRLIDKLERAIDELDDYVTTVHTKEKIIEYDDEGKKPLIEKVVDTQDMQIKKGIIDRSALKQLVGTLKELKGKEDVEEDTNSVIEVVMSDDVRELAQ